MVSKGWFQNYGFGEVAPFGHMGIDKGYIMLTKRYAITPLGEQVRNVVGAGGVTETEMVALEETALSSMVVLSPFSPCLAKANN